MAFTVNPEQLGILNRVLDQHCAAQGITEIEARRLVATRILHLFSTGVVKAEAIASSLADRGACHP